MSNDLKTFVYLIEPTRPAMVEAPTEEEGAKVSAHFAHLKELADRGVVLMAGRTLEAPHLGMVVFLAPDRASAKAIVDADPAVAAGVFQARLSELSLPLFGGRR